MPTLSLLDGRADQGVVFVVDTDDIARRRSVQTAGIADDGVLVISGLRSASASSPPARPTYATVSRCRSPNPAEMDAITRFFVDRWQFTLVCLRC